MKTELIYFENKNILNKSLSEISDVIRDIFSGSDQITFTPCTEETFKKAYKKALKKNDLVFIATHHEDAHIQQSVKEKYFDETYMFLADEELYAFVAEVKRTIVASITLCKDYSHVVSYIIGKFFVGDDYDFFAHRQLNVSTYSAETVHELLASYCKSENPRIYIVEDSVSTKIHIFTGENSKELAEDLCEEVFLNIKMLLGDNSYVSESIGIERNIVEGLLANGLTVATAESCTAGLLSSAITSVPNASSVFEIGISSYSNRIKRAALNVSRTTIDTYGAVSKETAAEMAIGILNLSNASLGLAITGVAGPSYSEDKPIGTVYMALTDGKNMWVINHQFDPNLTRDEVRQKSVYEALDLLRRYLEFLPSILPNATKIGEPLNLLTSQPHYIGDSIEYSDGMLHKRVVHEADFIIDDTFDSPEVPFATPIFENLDDEYEETFDSEFLTEEPVEEEEEPQEEKPHPFSFLSDKIKRRRIITAVIFAIVIAGIVCGSFFAITYFTAKSTNDKVIDEARQMWEFYDDRNEYGMFEAFDDLRKNNKEITGWIKIGNSEINNPVCMTKDNSFYKNHNHLLDKTRYGSIYFDYRSNANQPRPNQNIVIYGNNMNDGSMFGSLSDYLNTSYVRKNSEIQLTTLYNNRKYFVAAVMIVSDDKDDNGKAFDFDKFEFKNETDYKKWLAEAKQRSIYLTDLDHLYTDEYITLVTDADYFKGAKLVIIARAARPNEKAPEYNTNPSPRYPQIWYDQRSVTNPYASGVLNIDDVTSSNTDDTTPSSPSDTTSSEDSSTPDDTTSSDNSSNSKPSSNTSSETTSSQPTTSEPTTSEPTTSEPTTSEPADTPPSGSDNNDTPPDSSDTSSTPDDTGSQPDDTGSQPE